MAQFGPIKSVMDEIPGNPSNIRGDASNTFDGQPGFQKGDSGNLPQVTLVDQGDFANPKPAGK